MEQDKEEFMHDWYEILGCDKDSSNEAIEKAARKLAVKYHPDKTSDPDAPAKFLLVQKAKEILLDSVKRKIIDDKKEVEEKRKNHDMKRNAAMDINRKRMRDQLNEKMENASNKKTTLTEAEVFERELRTRSKIIDSLRKKNGEMMTREEDNMNSSRTDSTTSAISNDLRKVLEKQNLLDAIGLLRNKGVGSVSSLSSNLQPFCISSTELDSKELRILEQMRIIGIV